MAGIFHKENPIISYDKLCKVAQKGEIYRKITSNTYYLISNNDKIQLNVWFIGNNKNTCRASAEIYRNRGRGWNLTQTQRHFEFQLYSREYVS